MLAPRIADLPAPPQEKTGWPWTEETPPVPATLPEGKPWPRISVITPSYNQGQFIEQTIRSVLLQGYPDLEYIIVDGGSSDESVGIIERYQKFLAYWASEPDRGQSHAINKGFARATGQIMCWLNSDDYYLPGTLKTVAENLAEGAGAYALVGHVSVVYVDGRPAEQAEGRYENRRRLLQFWKGYRMPQSSIFWRREVFDSIGFLDERQHYIMDFDYWARIAEQFSFKNVDQVLSCATYHSQAKTGDNYLKYQQELRRHAPKYWGSPLRANYWRLKSSQVNHSAIRPFVKKVRDLPSRIMRRTKVLLGDEFKTE